MTAFPAFMTVEEFETFPFPDGKVELIRGAPRWHGPEEAPHGWVQSNLASLLFHHLPDRQLGYLFPCRLGYELSALPVTMRSPDLSFIRAERFPIPVPQGFAKMPPDLAVEILSPADTSWEVDEALEDYRAAGIPLIWVIDGMRKAVRVISGNAPVRWLAAGDTLDGGNVIPGFSCPVAALFEGLAP